MDAALKRQWAMADQDQRISEAIERDRSRLRNFIRRRVPDREDAEDVLQDVFYELVEAYRLMKPVEQVTAWLFGVARNRITDLFRKKKREALRTEPVAMAEDREVLQLEEWLASPDAGPEALYAGGVLPEEQREVFIAHELKGQSFKEIAARTGVSVNTLLSRKHYAVLHLRGRLQAIRDEFLKA